MLSLTPVKWTRILVPIAAGLLLLAAACGDDDGGSGDDTATPAATADGIQAQPASPQEVDDEVTETVDGVLQTARSCPPSHTSCGRR